MGLTQKCIQDGLAMIPILKLLLEELFPRFVGIVLEQQFVALVWNPVCQANAGNQSICLLTTTPIGKLISQRSCGKVCDRRAVPFAFGFQEPEMIRKAALTVLGVVEQTELE